MCEYYRYTGMATLVWFDLPDSCLNDVKPAWYSDELCLSSYQYLVISFFP